MASHTVIVLTPNGRRNTVKCNVNTTILQILEQTCSKHDFKPEEYDLKHHSRILDPSSIIRFAGLPNNAYTEMVPAKRIRCETEVVIGLQLENGERKMGSFSPSANLYELLTSLAPEESDPSSNPVVIYMRREVYGLEALKETTLKSLGLTTGRAIIRLIHKTPEQLKIQPNISSPLTVKPKPRPIEEISETTRTSNKMETISETGEASSTAESIDIPAPSETKISIPTQKELEEPMETNVVPDCENSTEDIEAVMKSDVDVMSTDLEDSDRKNLEKEIIILGERNALVFSQDTSDNLPLDDLPDDFYDLTVNEVKKLFRDLEKKRAELENVPFQTSAMRELAENRRVITQLHDYRKVVLRIIFPDRTVLQGTFGPIDSIQVVKDFVNNHLQNPNGEFDLYVTPPKKILDPKATLVDSNCVPSCVIYFGPWLDESEMAGMSQSKYLRDDILSQLTSPQAAALSAAKTRGINFESKSTSDSNQRIEQSESGRDEKSSGRKQIGLPGPSSTNSKLPKWYKPTH